MDSMNAQEWAAIFAGLSTLAAIITAIIAAWSLAGSRRDSEDRTRPLVIATLKPGPTMSHGVNYLTIENAGQSVARGVAVAFDPPLPDYEFTEDGQKAVVAPFLRRRYGSKIEMLAPGQSLRNVYSYHSVGTDGNVEPVPDEFIVTVRYTDDHGKPFEDSFLLDVGLLNMETLSSPSDSNDAVKRQNQALEAIVWELWH